MPVAAVARDGAGWRLLHRTVRVAAVPAALLILLHLPLDLSWRLPGALMYLQPWDVAKDTALLVLFYALACAALGLAWALVAAPLDLAGRRWGERWVAIGVLAGAFLVLLALAPMAQAWWHGVRAGLGLTISLRWLKWGLALALGLALLHWLRSRGLTGVAADVDARLAPTRRALAVVLALALGLVVATGHARLRPFGWSDRPAAAATGTAGPDVFVIIIDALSAQDMSLYGFARETTPRLARFAQRSHVFDHFFAASNFTTPSVTSLLTGRDVSSHRVYHLGGMLAPAERPQTLAQVLRAHGYATGAAVSNLNGHPLAFGAADGFAFLSPVLERLPFVNYSGLVRFERAKLTPVVRDVWERPLANRLRRRFGAATSDRRNPYPPELVTAAARGYLAAAPGPQLAWLHYYPPHSPYLPPAPFLGRFLPEPVLDSWSGQDADPGRSGMYDVAALQGNVDRLRLRYDEHIAHVDDEVGRYLDELDAQGRLQDALVIITADHGESFERGWQGHTGLLLHDALIRVPLLIHLPGQTTGSRVATWGGHVDLLPTVLDALGLPVPAWTDGRSLLPAMRGEALPERPLLSMNLETSSRFATPPRRGSVAVMERPYKLVHYLDSGCEELYDLAADPREAQSLASSHPQVADRLRATLAARAGLPLQAPADRARRCDPLRFVAEALK